MSIDDEWHLFVLHYLFFSRIQEELNEFKCAWNNHQVSTEGKETPLQILVLRADSFPDPVDVNDDYGVEASDKPLTLDTPPKDLENWFHIAIEYVLEMKEI